MQTPVLDRETDVRAGTADPAPSMRGQGEPSRLHRPPTLFGQQSSRELVEAGHALAREALGFRSAGFSFDEAAAKLLQPDLRREVLLMAREYLAYTRFNVPLRTQVDALFVLDDVLYRLDLEQHQVAGRLRRVLSRVWDWTTHRGRDRHGRGAKGRRHRTFGRGHVDQQPRTGRAVFGR